MGPKKNQNKGEKLSLGAFLGDSISGSWADEMDEQPVNSFTSASRGYGTGRNYDSPSMGGGERITGGAYEGYSQREELPLPTRPPYTAHLGNLSFDVTSGDINDYFGDCEVTNVRIVEDKLDRKPKGFGYVEFGSLEGLKKALELSGSSFQGRNIRVSVAEPPKDRQEAREITDWSRKGPLSGPDSSSRPGMDRGGFRDGGRGFESERGDSRRGPYGDESGDGRVRDFGNWERKGPLSPSAGGPAGGMGPRRESGGVAREPRAFERHDSPSWGEGRAEGQSQDGGSRPPRPAPVERVPTAAEKDNQWRARMKPDAPSPVATPEASTPSSPAAAAPALATRPKLNLTKRTVSEAPSDAPASASDSKASPFGAAKPINTAQRELEVEEKRLALRQKQDEERKAREEKRAADKAAKGDKSVAAGGAEKRERKEPKDKENGATSPGPQQPKFEILRRIGDESGEGADGDEGAAEGDANGEIIGDTSVKPQEVVRDTATGATNTPSTGEAMADEGWETVPKASGRKGKGATGPRALAS